MSHVRRLRISDRIFFVTVNLRRRVAPFSVHEYSLLTDALEGARRRLGFLPCGYVLMPDHWHALIWVSPPLTISSVIHDVKKVSARRLHERRANGGTGVAASILGPVCASREGIRRAVALYAPQPGSQEPREQARGMAMVEATIISRWTRGSQQLARYRLMLCVCRRVIEGDRAKSQQPTVSAFLTVGR